MCLIQLYISLYIEDFVIPCIPLLYIVGVALYETHVFLHKRGNLIGDLFIHIKLNFHGLLTFYLLRI